MQKHTLNTPIESRTYRRVLHKCQGTAALVGLNGKEVSPATPCGMPWTQIPAHAQTTMLRDIVGHANMGLIDQSAAVHTWTCTCGQSIQIVQIGDRVLSDADTTILLVGRGGVR